MDAKLAALTAVFVAAMLAVTMADDTNRVYSPCADTKVQKDDGFSFGIAFSTKQSFSDDKKVQLSPCDRRLSLSSAEFAVFRPKVDEISLLTINTTLYPSVTSGGFMVAFAGRKYAARSLPIFVGNNTYSVTSFTLVLEFKKGTLQNLYWKKDGCASCSGKSSFVCINKQNCAIRTSSCKSQGGAVDCSIGIQLAFSGTDKHDAALNSWYEVSKLRQYSLYGLYSNLKGSLTSQYSKFF
ncbi:hypothetical protein QJS10_CPA08g00020 [Acorus calamus]|uniref:Expp1 protein n=1 Tax=Acorus calamus TaxID=4465 RepID=A0AAV9E9Z4_ACOCL|nr:hypothetical protein QJS10_CPA08g00020 [Acorus calamus]